MTETATRSQRTLPPDIADFCRRAVEALRAKLPVREVWLFGSHAEGTANEHSDVDLFVVLEDGHGMKDPWGACYDALDGIRPNPRRDLDVCTLDESYWHHPRYRHFGLWSDVAEKGICLFECGDFFPPSTNDLPLMPGDPTLPDSWYKHARQDLKIASVVLAEDEELIEGVLTHLQQAAEKLLKGWLIDHGWYLIKTHNLVELCDQASQRGVDLSWYPDGKILSEAFFQSRYPGPENFLTRGDVEAITARVERLFRELNIDL